MLDLLEKTSNLIEKQKKSSSTWLNNPYREMLRKIGYNEVNRETDKVNTGMSKTVRSKHELRYVH